MTFSVPRGPQRIVCLTEEWTEILYLLGEAERIVGISAYTLRPPEARRDKPVVSAFIGGSLEKIRALNPDLVIGFSDVQANFARELIAAHLPVLIFNQRSLQEILDVIVALGNLVGAGERARRLVEGYVARLEAAREAAEQRRHRPRVYFEEWDDPQVSCIRWVSELIELAGGRNVFADRSLNPGVRERAVTPEEVRAADPELMFASWCGKPFDKQAVLERAVMREVAAVRHDQIYEVPSEIILQPGPACLTDGLDYLARIIGQVD